MEFTAHKNKYAVNSLLSQNLKISYLKISSSLSRLDSTQNSDTKYYSPTIQLVIRLNFISD